VGTALTLRTLFLLSIYKHNRAIQSYNLLKSVFVCTKLGQCNCCGVLDISATKKTFKHNYLQAQNQINIYSSVLHSPIRKLINLEQKDNFKIGIKL